MSEQGTQPPVGGGQTPAGGGYPGGANDPGQGIGYGSGPDPRQGPRQDSYLGPRQDPQLGSQHPQGLQGSQNPQHPQHPQGSQRPLNPQGVGANPPRAVEADDAEGYRTRQPDYGQVKLPEYGALRNQFPPNYDPYLFGHPDAPVAAQQSKGPQFPGIRQGTAPIGFNRPVTRSGGAPRTQAQSPSAQRQSQPGQAGQNAAGYQPRMFHGIDLNDPNQNPLYGRWDMYAILALVFALFSVPILPAVMGGISMWRTKTFNMHGFWLGLTAVIINVASTVFSMWLMSRGVSMQELYSWLLDRLEAGSGNGSSVSA